MKNTNNNQLAAWQKTQQQPTGGVDSTASGADQTTVLDERCREPVAADEALAAEEDGVDKNEADNEVPRMRRRCPPHPIRTWFNPDRMFDPDQMFDSDREFVSRRRQRWTRRRRTRRYRVCLPCPRFDPVQMFDRD